MESVVSLCSGALMCYRLYTTVSGLRRTVTAVRWAVDCGRAAIAYASAAPPDDGWVVVAPTASQEGLPVLSASR